MIFSLVILLFINPVQGLPSFFSPSRERISVRGTLMCGDNTAENYRMELFEEDPVWNDLLISTESDENGRFGINAVDGEIGGIEAFLLIHNRCNEEKNCVRLRKIAIPSYMINRVLVLNNMNLNRTIRGEARICDTANARPEVYVRNFEKSNEEVETVVPKIGASEASIQKPVTLKETLGPRNDTSDSTIRTPEPEINGRKFSIKEKTETMDLFIVTTESSIGTSVLPKGETPQSREERSEPSTITEELRTAKSEPRFGQAKPTFETVEPTYETTEPAFETTEATDEIPEPVMQTEKPKTEIPEPISGTPGPTTDSEGLETKTSEPAFQMPEPSEYTPEPSTATPYFTLVTSKLMHENPETTAETEELKMGTTESSVEREASWNKTEDSKIEISEERKSKPENPLVEVPHVLIKFDLP